jgi:hypothetical protein
VSERGRARVRDGKTAVDVFHPFELFKSFNGSTVREASRQASSTAFSSEPAEESP